MPGAKGRSGGHNKKTRREKELLGVDKYRLGKENPPDIIRGPLDKFEGLKESGEAVWVRYEEMLRLNGTLSKADAPAFHALTKKWEQWYETNKLLDKMGPLIPIRDDEGKTTDYKANPLIHVEQEYYKQLVSSFREFGLTPLSRDNIQKIAEKKEINPFAGILSK